MDIRLKDKIVPAYYDAWKAFKDARYLNYYLKGGRGASKSTTISIKMVINRMRTKTHGLCVRKLQNSLRGTVRNQVIWAINHLQVSDYWSYSTSTSGDMTLTYVPTGTKIFFEGADGERLKGWKTPDMPTTDIFFEEIQNYKTDDELSSIKLSILREKLPEGYKYSFFHAYNPPKRKQSWVNKLCETQFIPENMYVHHSSYLDNPFIPQEFIQEAENTKKRNKHRYEWEYLGKPIGGGVVPFNNLEFREITDEEIKNFDNIRQGIDWGYSVDPFAFGRSHYDKKKRIIYIFDEIYQVKLSNRRAAEIIKAKGYNDVTIIADSSEPKSIEEMRSYGIKIKGAKKPAGSVEYGEKWLDDLEKIVIDPRRCPNTSREFENIDYQVDRNGEIIPRLEDKNNHTIDNTRYAYNDDMQSYNMGWA